MIREGLDHAVSLSKSKVHVITGRLERSIGAEYAGYRGTFIADAPYAAAEMARGGTHDFATEPFNAGVELIHERVRELLE